MREFLRRLWSPPSAVPRPTGHAPRASWMWWAAALVAGALFVTVCLHQMRASKRCEERYAVLYERVKIVWRGWDFYGVAMAASSLAKEGAKAELYPPTRVTTLDEWNRWSRPYADRLGIGGVGSGTYFYPPILAVLMEPAAREGPYRLQERWNWTARAMMPALVVLSLLLAWRAYGRFGVAEAAVACALMALSYPILWGVVECSNVSILMALLTTGALWALLSGRVVLFGALLALAIQLKISPVIILPWLVLRRKWAALASVIVASAVLLAVSVHFAGWDNHVRYVRNVMPFVSTGDAFFPNQSLTGLVRRAAEVELFRFDLAPAEMRIALMAKALSALALGAAYLALLFWTRRAESAPRLAAEFMLLVAAGLAASPLSWEHHYTMAFPLWVLLWAGARHWLDGADRWIALGLGAVAALLCTAYFPAELLGHRPWLRHLSSYQLYALVPAVAALAMIHARDRRKVEATAGNGEGAASELPQEPSPQ